MVEVMTAIVILSIAVIGASGYRYHAALNARKANTQVTAARIALLLCESWRGAGDPNAFDPTQLASGDDPNNSVLVIEVSTDGPAVLSEFTALGSYEIVIESFYYWATLSWKDDATAGLRALNAVVVWDKRGSGSGLFENADKSFKLTTYINY